MFYLYFRHRLVLEQLSQGSLSSCKFKLKVIEKNRFKEICHLSLDLNAGTETEILTYLAAEVSSLKVSKMTDT
jgi:hypothetical protein